MDKVKKFAIGMKVKFVSNPLPRFADDPHLSKEMERIVRDNFNKTMEVVLNEGTWYRLDIDDADWNWDERWLMEVKQPARDERGRFIKKAAEAPKKEEEKKEHLPIKGEIIRDVLTKGVGDVGTCTYGIQYEKESILQLRDVCHARLRIDREGIGKPLFAALHMKGHFTGKTDEWKKYFRIFLKYALNKSAFKNCFITKDVTEAEEKGILLNMEEKNSRVVAAAIYLRSFTEFDKTITLFSKLVDNGVPIGAAWLLSQGVDSNLKYTGYNGGHHCIIGTMRMDVLIEGIVKGNNFPDIDEPPFHSAKERYKIFKAISGDDLYYIEPNHGKETLSDFMMKYGKTNKGGFGGGVRTYTMFDLMKIAAKWTE